MKHAERIASLAVGVIALPILIASPAPAAQGPDGVTIDIVTQNGSGCPAKKTNVTLSPDHESFVINYDPDDFTVRAGGDSTPTSYRKNCQLSLRISGPASHTFAIRQVDHRVTVNLEKGVSGHLRSNYFFSGMPSSIPLTFDVLGPLKTNWQVIENPDAESLVYKPCGEERTLLINIEIRVNLGTSDPAKVSSMSFGPDSKPAYHFAWKRCP
ncbi:DUF4360 domain-containing protein [Actinomadura macra]|uniref:DUF4360 domain-containing protein n=1 Tax=Actinomadura macra TaxID=46164 RepID=UPI00082DAFCD|nr:DUF4360 domain-containing protein [Actinomadura macra]